MKIEDKIIVLLPYNKKNAITTKQLTEVTGLTVRQLKDVIVHLRQTFPILSKTEDGGGYWISRNKQEVDEFCVGLKSRADAHLKTIEMMTKLKREMSEL